MRPKSSFLPMILILSLFSLVAPAIGAENYTTASGGVSGEERGAFEATHTTESLKLTFSGPGGEYLSDVLVAIRDAKGDTVVNVNSPGPIFVAALPAGSYDVSATLDGETHSQRVKIDKSGARKSITLRFAARAE